MNARRPFVPHLVLQQLVEDNPDHILVEFTEDRAYTASELYTQAEVVAAGLQRAGHVPGERVALMIGNRIEFLAWWLGVAMAGLVSVPLNTAMRGDILRRMLALSGPAVVVLEAERRSDVLEASMGLERKPEILVVSRGSSPGSTFDYLARANAPMVYEAHPSSLASIMFTSGTTGASKGVMWSHRMSMGMAESAMVVMGYRESDVVFTCLPLFHANGLCTSFLPALQVGARLVVAPRFSASGFWTEVNACGATTTNMLGSMAALLWKAPPSSEEHSHRLRRALVIPPPTSYQDEFEARFNLQCTQLYGSTDVGIPLGVPEGVRGHPESCGRQLPGWECHVVDERDEPVPAGQVGELVVRPLVPFLSQLGYYRMPEETVEAWRNLWFHTGDVMRCDSEGWFQFVDRTKDAMRRSGENISSFEVEQVVLAHDAVEEAAAYGVSAELGEDDVMVAVVLRAGRAVISPAELVDWCRERLPYFAVPRYIELLDELPRTPTEKVRKSSLRARGVTHMTYDAGLTRRAR